MTHLMLVLVVEQDYPTLEDAVNEVNPNHLNLPNIIVFVAHFIDCIMMLTAVDIRDAKFISRFPLSPSNTGTIINSWVICVNTVQC